MKHFTIAACAVLAAGVVVAQDKAPFGGEADKTYAADLWSAMTEMRLAGDGAIMAFPYEGSDPHGAMLETLYSSATVDGHTGVLVVKRNYAPSAEDVDGVLTGDEHLAAVTVMFQREDGYDPETNNWFYAKYLPDGSLDQNPAGMALAGLVGKGGDAGCIACHQGAGGDDFLFTTDADLSHLTQ